MNDVAGGWKAAVQDARRRIDQLATRKREQETQHDPRARLLCGAKQPARGQHPTRRAWGPGIGLGKSAATAANVTKLNELLTPCGDPECGALVQVNALVREARRVCRWDKAVNAADACTARRHVKHFDAAKFVGYIADTTE